MKTPGLETARTALARRLADTRFAGARNAPATAGARARARWARLAPARARAVEHQIGDTWVTLAMRGRADKWIEEEARSAIAQALERLDSAAREDGIEKEARASAHNTWKGAIEEFTHAWVDAELGDARATLARAADFATRSPTLLGVVLGRLGELSRVNAAAWRAMEDAPAWLRTLWVMHLARDGPQPSWEAMTQRAMEIIASRTGVGTCVAPAQARHVLERWRWPNATPPLAVLAFADTERPETDIEWAALVRAEHAAGEMAGVRLREGRAGVSAALAEARAREAGLVQEKIDERAFNWTRVVLGTPVPGVVLEAMRRRWARERALATREPTVLRATARGQMTWERPFEGPADVIVAASVGQGAQGAEGVIEEAAWGGVRYWVGPGDELAVAERVPHGANDTRIEAMRRVMGGETAGGRWERRERAKRKENER